MSFFPKELLKKFPRTRRMPFWQLWWSVFAEKPKYFAVNERKWWKFLIFSKNFFSSKLSYGHLDIRCDDPTEMFLPEVANLLLKLGNWIRIYVFKFFSQTLLLDTQKANSKTLLRNFRQSFQTVWLEVQKWLEGTSNFSKKSFSLQIVPLDCIFDKSAETFVPKVRNVFAQNRKILKSFVLFQKQFSDNLFAWTPSLHFWQTSQKFSDEGWKFFCRKSRKVMKRKFILPKTIIETLLCRRKLQFWEPC